METLETIRADQLETFAHFLEEHPSFSPLLFGEDALVCGFQVGQCLLSIEEMEQLVNTKQRRRSRDTAAPRR
jgi:hypothetical protein